jgi:hypothetical protein
MSMIDINRGQFWQVSAGENLSFASPRRPPLPSPGAATDSHPDTAIFIRC